jgi:LPS-assembly lipoprotein
MMMRRLLLAASLLALSGCGLQPLYQGGGNAAAVQGLGGVEVPAISGKAGWLMRAALVDRLGSAPRRAVRAIGWM